MEALRVEVKSREVIKPSSPTPHHLKTLHLSFLDQMPPPAYIPIIFFYPNEPNHPNNHTELSNVLKQSLSDTLVRFYPLAGMVEGNMLVDCNDQGALFNEAHVDTDLSKFVEKPNLEDLRALLPFQPIINSSKNMVLGIQVNRFSCGGVAISMCVSHNVADGTAASDFVLAWAKATRAIQQVVHDNEDNIVVENPKFNAASYFPPKNVKGISTLKAPIYKEKVVSKRFIFDKKKIDVLKEHVATSSAGLIEGSLQGKTPTKVEVVSAFIWKHVIEADRTSHDPNKSSTASHFVNLRSRREPPIPNDCFGNFCWFATANYLVKKDIDQSELVGKLGEAIRKIDNDYIKILETDQYLLELKKLYDSSCHFTSWCRFPLYEVNFGWGKPIWVSTNPSPYKNMVMLLSTKSGEGIEAWVSMVEDDIVILEQDFECL